MKSAHRFGLRIAKRWASKSPKIDFSKDYYGILGLTFPCSLRQIRVRFLIEAKKWHPDMFQEGTVERKRFALDQFLLIQEAYEVLRTESSKRQYDNVLYPQKQRVEMYQSYVNPNNMNNSSKVGGGTGMPNFGARAVRYRNAAPIITDDYDAIERKIKELLMDKNAVRDHPNTGFTSTKHSPVGQALRNLAMGVEKDHMKLRNDHCEDIASTFKNTNRGLDYTQKKEEKEVE